MNQKFPVYNKKDNASRQFRDVRITSHLIEVENEKRSNEKKGGKGKKKFVS